MSSFQASIRFKRCRLSRMADRSNGSHRTGDIPVAPSPNSDYNPGCNDFAPGDMNHEPNHASSRFSYVDDKLYISTYIFEEKRRDSYSVSLIWENLSYRDFSR